MLNNRKIKKDFGQSLNIGSIKNKKKIDRSESEKV